MVVKIYAHHSNPLMLSRQELFSPYVVENWRVPHFSIEDDAMCQVYKHAMFGDVSAHRRLIPVPTLSTLYDIADRLFEHNHKPTVKNFWDVFFKQNYFFSPTTP